ncbi:MAG: phosphate/phosphite/phosphonate ABC transporter substrate-binding protein [Brevirhabdus sp.]
MIASLPMYDRPETAAANDRLFAALRDRLADGPDTLSRGGDPWEDWRAPNLLISQTCGYPYRARLHRQVSLIGAGDHRLEGCAPGHYCSVFVARDAAPLAAFQDGCFAYNDALSQSGWAAPMVHAAQAGVGFGPLVHTGAHRESARAVAEGRADIAALDAVSWTMMQRWDGFATGLCVVARTAPTPALPFITAPTRDPARLFTALSDTVAALSQDDRDTLCLHGLVRVEAAAYLSVPTPPPPAQA